MAEPLPTEATSPPPEAAVVLAPLGGVLLSMETVESAVELVTRLAVEMIPDTVGAGVTLVDDRGQRSTAASNAFVAEVDALQYALDSGPCLTAWLSSAGGRNGPPPLRGWDCGPCSRSR